MQNFCIGKRLEVLSMVSNFLSKIKMLISHHFITKNAWNIFNLISCLTKWQQKVHCMPESKCSKVEWSAWLAKKQRKRFCLNVKYLCEALINVLILYLAGFDDVVTDPPPFALPSVITIIIFGTPARPPPLNSVTAVSMPRGVLVQIPNP